MSDLSVASNAPPSIARMRAAAWMVTGVFMLSNTPTPLYVHWQEQLGFSSGMLTVIFALYIAGLLGTLLLAGQLSDHYGRKPVLLPGLFAALAACGLFAGASSIGMLAAGRLLTGIAVGVIVSAGMAAVVDAGGPEHRRRAALLASIAMVLGAGLGPLLAGGLSQALAQPVVPIFTLEAAILLSALAIALCLPARNTQARPPLRLRLPHVPAPNLRQVLCGIATFGPGITATSFVLSLGPSLLARLLHERSPLLAGGMACAMFFAAVGVQFAVRRWPVARIFLASALATVLAMLGLLLCIYGASATAFVAAALFAGAAQGLGQLGGLTLIGLHVPDSHRAQSNAVLNIGGYIPAGLLPVATGYLIDAVGLAQGATLFAVVLAAIALIGGLWAWRQTP
ncbi:putative MFS family arabinose efflux permease [Gibbsiella quercinecans]|uniref:MFS transporter n=1 Tax=Gibbsiella quercinecans TaxID=929813 RepID=A0A250B5Z8_9GAMM|nr:MFS transporter [Gibbsiella quercinecans]ATA21589.1 MFS transporter [Gibbsiella quercinecans]RLM02890.1 MFS transporter [Gibbsiella quercinecans]RLM06205.1 MFS transporter [Gibbsiella quercinecans]TCT88830.1 putative MFS family arabinose efflux permease [Gibbsiella quercinecans]